MGLSQDVEINTDHQEPRQALILLLDTSSSMAQSGDIVQLNQGLRELESSLRDPPASRRVEIAIVTFGGQVERTQDFVEVARFEPPHLAAHGATPMGEAIQLAIGMVERRKEVYKSKRLEYYRPWIFMITDGEPTDNWQAAASAVQQAEAASKLAFYVVGTDTANFDILKRIASEQRKPLKLRDNNWQELFRWLSRSMKTVSGSTPGDKIQFERPTAPDDGWASAP